MVKLSTPNFKIRIKCYLIKKDTLPNVKKDRDGMISQKKKNAKM